MDLADSPQDKHKPGIFILLGFENLGYVWHWTVSKQLQSLDSFTDHSLHVVEGSRCVWHAGLTMAAKQGYNYPRSISRI